VRQETALAHWKLRFKPERIRQLADRYQYEDDTPILEIGRRARENGEFGFKDFLKVCKWKTSRSQARCRENTPDEVAEITRIALSTSIEHLRIGVLRCLHGVGWPTASVLLHIAHRDPYPILDFRALWSLGFDKPPVYSFALWWRYVETCRELARKQRIDMRTLDKALWQYSKEHQPEPR